jgi:hypothetical protein
MAVGLSALRANQSSFTHRKIPGVHFCQMLIDSSDHLPYEVELKRKEMNCSG